MLRPSAAHAAGEPLGQEFGARVETFNRECEVVEQSAIPAKSPRADEAKAAESGT